MSQDNLIKFRCVDCKRMTHFSTKNKKTITQTLQLKKFCKWCRGHKMHKESKK